MEFEGVKYYKLNDLSIEILSCNNKKIIKFSKKDLRVFVNNAFKNISFFFRKSQLELFKKISTDESTSANDRMIADLHLKNAVSAASGIYPLCQDTGTATVYAERGQNITTDFDENQEIQNGIIEAYTKNNLRYSQLIPQNMLEEINSSNNSPGQVDINYSNQNGYTFIFTQKGGGSANKTALYQESKTILQDDLLKNFLKDKIDNLGSAGCPPYRLAIVIGGTSPENNLKLVKLATSGYFDNISTGYSTSNTIFRDEKWEQIITKMGIAHNLGLGYGGKYNLGKVTVLRASRHAASLPIGIGVGCASNRNCRGIINSDGFFLEELEMNPQKYLSDVHRDNKATKIDLSKPLPETIKTLNSLNVGTYLELTGEIIVARDIAHSRFLSILKKSQKLPEYLTKYPLFYAGPAKTPDGKICGSFGPTTAKRMDLPLIALLEKQASLISIAKGERSHDVIDALKKNNGFYLGTPGGPAAYLSEKHIKKMEIIDFQELAMEAVYKITVRDFPAFIAIDNKGNSINNII